MRICDRCKSTDRPAFPMVLFAGPAEAKDKAKLTPRQSEQDLCEACLKGITDAMAAALEPPAKAQAVEPEAEAKRKPKARPA